MIEIIFPEISVLGTFWIKIWNSTDSFIGEKCLFLRKKPVYNTKEIFSADLTKTSYTLCFELRMVQTRRIPLSKMDEVPYRYLSIFINSNNNNNNSRSSSSNVSEKKKRMLNIKYPQKGCYMAPVFFIATVLYIQASMLSINLLKFGNLQMVLY